MTEGTGSSWRISLADAVARLEPPLSRQYVVAVNEGIVRVAGLEGELEFHHHDEDEFFLC